MVITVHEMQGVAPFISPWPTKLLMFGEDMQSDLPCAPVIGTVEFCFSTMLVLQ